jgi:hypothetical protein
LYIGKRRKQKGSITEAQYDRWLHNKRNETCDVAPVVKVPKDGKLYEEGGRWKFKVAGEVYQYKTKELAKAGLELVANG